MVLNNTTSQLGSVRITYCSNSPILGDACTPSTGLNALVSTYRNEVGNTGFTKLPSPDSTTNEIILSRTPAVPTSPNFRFELAGVINPDDLGTHYVRIQTYESVDASGPALEEGGIAFSINRPFQVAAEVPPFLKFCVGTAINQFDCASATTFLLNLGVLSPQITSAASSQFVVATNAGNGFSVTMAGTTLTSGNNTIAAMLNAGSSVGTSQFGVNVRANNNPAVGAESVGPGAAFAAPNYNVPNNFRFVNNETIAGGPGATDNKKFTVSYVTNVSQAQPAGVYATTISFICLANF